MPISPCEPSKTLYNKQKTLTKTKEIPRKKNTKETKTPKKRRTGHSEKGTSGTLKGGLTERGYSHLLRAARLQNVLHTKNGLKNAKNQKNDPKRDRNVLSPSQAASKYFTGTSLKVFHCSKFAKKFSPRGSAGVATLTFVCQYIISPRSRTGNGTVTRMQHPLFLKDDQTVRDNRLPVQCRTSRRGDIVL